MEKSFNKTIKEVQRRIVQICNESDLSPIILELILQNLLSEVHLMVEKQMFEEALVCFNNAFIYPII